MVNRRQIMEAVFDGRAVDRLPVSIRLDLWNADLVSSGSEPEAIKGLSAPQVEDYLGFSRAARYRTNPTLVFEGIPVERSEEGGMLREKLCFPEKVLSTATYRGEELARRGMDGHVVEYLLRGEEDYTVLLAHMDEALLRLDLAGFAAFDRETGETGLPLLISGACPAHSLMIQLTGYQNFYYHAMDFPQTVDRLIGEIERIYRRDLWPAFAETNARIILHGTHFSSQMTPVPVFEKYFLPYFREFNALMHGHGKKVLCHADAEMGMLLEQVEEAGFDGTDCLVTHPLVEQRIEDYFAAWGGRIVCWGGLPSIIFDPTFPLEEYKEYIRRLVDITRKRGDFIFGTGDNVMPGAEWERLTFLAEQTGCR